MDFTPLEPAGMQVHIRLNSLLSKYGFFRSITAKQKEEFDAEFEKIVSSYLPYSDDDASPEAIALAKLRVEADIIMNHLPDVTTHDRLSRLEGVVGVLVRALHIKGALELEDVRRELFELGH